MDPMTPSVGQKEMTEGQINKALANHRALLEKHAPQFDADAVQQVLGDPEYAAEQFAVLRRRVEASSNMIVRRVKVNRTRTSQETITATGLNEYLDKDVVASMPIGEGDEVDVYFFKPDKSAYDKNGLISNDELAKQYELRGLKPDPRAQAAVNEADSAFADEHPNGTHWKDADGKWCFVSFFRWPGERHVLVRRNGPGWRARWLFAGSRK